MPRCALAIEAIAHAVALHGRKRGYALVGRYLGITERTVRAVKAGECGVSAEVQARALAAALELRRARAARLRAELAALEAQDRITDADTRAPAAVAGQPLP